MTKEDIRRERFVRVSESRMAAICEWLRKLENCSKPESFAYDEAQVEALFATLRSAVDSAEKQFYNQLQGRKQFSLSETYTKKIPQPISWDRIVSALPDVPNQQGIWESDGLILCKRAEQANAVADFLEACGITECAATGYFDPAEDERNGEVTRLTGWHYVDC